METLIHADIFFFITSIAVGVLTIALCVLAYFAYRALSTINEIGELVRDETVRIKDDIDGARATIKKNADVFGTIIGAVARSGFGTKATKRTKTKKNS